MIYLFLICVCEERLCVGVSLSLFIVVHIHPITPARIRNRTLFSVTSVSPAASLHETRASEREDIANEDVD